MASTNQKITGCSSHARLTKTQVDRLVHSSTSVQQQTFLRDTELRGFGVRVTSQGSKSFIVEKRVKGRVSRFTLGHYPDLTVEQARKQAQKLLGQIATGIDPRDEARKEAAKGVTLAQCLEDFLRVRRNLRPATALAYRRAVCRCFSDWLNRPLSQIDRDAVQRRHSKLGAENGPAYANQASRVLRALFNFALYQYELPSGERVLHYNPVQWLNHTRAWFRVQRRQTVIKPYQLKPWHEAVEALRSKGGHGLPNVIADYLLLLLYTGLRRTEGAQLKWSDIDLEDRTLRINDPKNHHPLVLPLSDFVFDLLARRYEVSTDEHVFPSSGKSGYLLEARDQMAWVTEQSGVPFTLHDLRRTFITTADRLDISAYAIKRLVNHKSGSNDVTAGYVVMDIERLRAPMQRITDALREGTQRQRDPAVIILMERRKEAIAQAQTRTVAITQVQAQQHELAVSRA